ncbi:enoyl-CoA hydratase/isomerase family protein [Halomarina halobia]|uniref:Enoyl-CoA hydratase/isomerase family protein n=1 Tax=Halomarina halobia TaxID=3033386 RepID=A0ABD6ACN6_9EURY|nr:enoyl-CoA hydratase-related protein [Halomarina sp. PSR21]
MVNASYENFETTFEDGVLRAEIHSTSKMNALNETMSEELLDLAVCLHDESVRCFVLTGSDGVFCAGGDVTTFASEDAPGEMRKGASLLHDAIVQLHQTEVPVIAGVNGAAVGAGFSLGIFGDFVLASDASYFQFGYPGIGATGDGASTYFLPRVAGLRQAKRITLLNERVGPEEAVDLGLATETVADDEFDERLREVAARVAEGPTVALGRTQQLLTESTSRGIEAQLAAETDKIAETAKTEDFREGVRAFGEGRTPEFEGR